VVILGTKFTILATMWAFEFKALLPVASEPYTLTALGVLAAGAAATALDTALRVLFTLCTVVASPTNVTLQEPESLVGSKWGSHDSAPVGVR
jgi:hypothetical protein